MCHGDLIPSHPSLPTEVASDRFHRTRFIWGYRTGRAEQSGSSTSLGALALDHLDPENGWCSAKTVGHRVLRSGFGGPSGPCIIDVPMISTWTCFCFTLPPQLRTHPSILRRGFGLPITMWANAPACGWAASLGLVPPSAHVRVAGFGVVLKWGIYYPLGTTHQPC